MIHIMTPGPQGPGVLLWSGRAEDHMDKPAGGWYNKSVRKGHRREERMRIMTDKELIAQTIERYTALQRIMKADDPQKEMENQKRILEVMLQAMGIVTEKLELE